MDKKRVTSLSKKLDSLTNLQFETIEKIVSQFLTPIEYAFNEKSDIFLKPFVSYFGDYLRLHHCLSKETFSKDKFEYALEKSLNDIGIKAVLSSKGNPGHDITIGGTRFSLKTQAEKSTAIDKIHISKFMEMGKGVWETEEDLIGLRQRFFDHMTSYERILILRGLVRGPIEWHYELVEIPKKLLEEAVNGKLEMVHTSKQTPKPGYCYVTAKDKTKFELYFDGGTERKLQIKNLDKQLCIIQAQWKFKTE
jgi:type II restriction enzyme